MDAAGLAVFPNGTRYSGPSCAVSIVLEMTQRGRLHSSDSPAGRDFHSSVSGVSRLEPCLLRLQM